MDKIIEEDVLQIINDNDMSKLKNRAVLITGATGMIGSYFVNTLIVLNEKYDMNINIIVLVRNRNKFADYILKNNKVTIIEQDVINEINYDGDIDYIIHAASPASPKIMANYPFETNIANTLGQVDPLIPRNGYAEGKKAAENMCVSVKQEYGLNVKIARLAHTYGPGMSIYDGRVQADFLKNVINNEDIIMKSTGASVRTYTYVSDAINAMFKILLTDKDVVYNISDEKSKITIKELAELLARIGNSKVIMDIPKEEFNKGGNAAFTLGILSSEKIRKELNWSPLYDLEKGFKRTLKYIKSNRK